MLVEHTLKTYQISNSEDDHPVGIIILEFPSTLDEKYSNRIAMRVADILADPRCTSNPEWNYDDVFKEVATYISQHARMGFRTHFIGWGNCDWSYRL